MHLKLNLGKKLSMNHLRAIQKQFNTTLIDILPRKARVTLHPYWFSVSQIIANYEHTATVETYIHLQLNSNTLMLGLSDTPKQHPHL